MSEERSIPPQGGGRPRSSVDHILAWAMGVLTFLGIMLVDIVAVFDIGWMTESSPVGMCGPIGSDAAIKAMLVMLAVGPLVAIAGAVHVGRRVLRARRAASARAPAS
jgi:hypothetical protein